MDKIKNLLQQVSIIQKKYDDLAEYSGEHYNVFDILGVTSSELSHSAILANLLNAKGKHGQKDLFLKIFIEQLKERFKNDELDLFNKFVSVNSRAETEKYAGRVDYESEQGGRIDIIIIDGKNNIIIENKIYAGDQYKQLIRYNEYDEKAPILYLNRFGTLPSVESIKSLKKELKINKEFFCISYEKDIVFWIEKCIKEMANKPIIRETLNQYLFLIKSLTNQLNNNNNNNMRKEIIDIMKNNMISSFEISNNLNDLKRCLFLSFFEKLKNKFSAEVEFTVDKAFGAKDNIILIRNKNWSDINVELYFLSDDYRGGSIGLINANRDIKIDEVLKIRMMPFLRTMNFGNDLNFANWYFIHTYALFAETHKAEFWEKINSDEFVNLVYEDILLIINGVNEYIKQ